MRLIIDRFAGIYAVCEDENKNMVNILKTKLPKDVKEGYVLEMTDESVRVNYEETGFRKKRIKGKMDSMWDQ